VEPGMVCSELNALLKPHGVHFAPDPGHGQPRQYRRHDRQQCAGACARCVMAMTIDHVLALDLALATGEVLNLHALNAQQLAAKCMMPGREGNIYRGLPRFDNTTCG